MVYVVMAYVAMAYVAMAYVAMAYLVMTYLVMAYILWPIYTPGHLDFGMQLLDLLLHALMEGLHFDLPHKNYFFRDPLEFSGTSSVGGV